MNKDKDVKAITEKFFAAYDAHDVDGMLALCADGAQGRYLPYGKKSVMPIRGGLEQIWRGFLGAVPDFGVEIVEMIQAEEQHRRGAGVARRRHAGGCPWPCNERQVRRIAHAYIIRYNADGKIIAPGLLLGQHRHQRH